MKLKEKCWNECKKIPKGKITTYEEIAKKLKIPPRAVGSAMRASPGFKKGIPCHRVICSDGKLGGFNQGVASKIKLLKKEGIKIKNQKVNLSKHKFKYKRKVSPRCKQPNKEQKY